MARAARRPAAKASTALFGPVTRSPPAKTPGIRVASVTGSASSRWMVAVSKARPGPKKLKSAVWPTAGITRSTSRVNSEPGTGTGQKRPPASGSPNSVFWATSPWTRPSPRRRTGRVRKWNCTPSRRASSTSEARAGMRSAVRR